MIPGAEAPAALEQHASSALAASTLPATNHFGCPVFRAGVFFSILLCAFYCG